MEEHKCKYVRREGESCSLNDNCTYPNCELETNSLEDVKRALKDQLGDKYAFALDNCFSLLQVYSGMEQQGNVSNNSFICKYSGGLYKLSTYGFERVDGVKRSTPDGSNDVPKKGFWQRVFNR